MRVADWAPVGGGGEQKIRRGVSAAGFEGPWAFGTVETPGLEAVLIFLHCTGRQDPSATAGDGRDEVEGYWELYFRVGGMANHQPRPTEDGANFKEQLALMTLMAQF